MTTQESVLESRVSRNGISLERHYTREGLDPLEQLNYESRDVRVYDRDDRTKIVFQMDGVEVPESWSQLATDILAEKYFVRKGVPETSDGSEFSARQVISRVADTIRYYGEQKGYFTTPDDAQIFQDELRHLLVNQMLAFNSPVWFNLGLNHKYGIEGDASGSFRWDFDKGETVLTEDGYSHPQCSACFIQSVGDSLMDMLELQKTEGRLFKYGSGTGTNFSNIRARSEGLSGGGSSSGLMSFLNGYDAWAGCIKSGGTTRRAAKMVIVDYDHPEILDFIEWKVKAEEIIRVLKEAGYDDDFEGEACAAVSGQNSNNSVRLDDRFLDGVERDGSYFTTNRLDGENNQELRNREVLRRISEAALKTGDPGVQHHDNINRWNPCLDIEEIRGSNPCSEFMFLDDSACNLASLNLMRFRTSEGDFDVGGYKHAIRVSSTAQEILVDLSSYPTQEIAQNTHDFRPIGLGFSNLGSLLMSWGLPYDSDGGRSIAASLTAIMTGEAYKQSARIAGTDMGPFERFDETRGSFLRVMKQHRDAAYEISASEDLEKRLSSEAREIWDEVVELGRENGFRNAQATVLAPTGTISFLMDCDTTGIEPEFMISKMKKLAGGGIMPITNTGVGPALSNLGYDDAQVGEMVEYVLERNTFEGAPHIREEHLAIFDTANKQEGSSRAISVEGHIGMMAAVQPFLSGAISKTVNLPKGATLEDIEGVYIDSWKAGLKSVALYVDGSKSSQPLNSGVSSEKQSDLEASVMGAPVRRKLPNERPSVTHKFSIAGHEGYLITGLYEDGTPGETFVTMSKEGSTIGGLIGSWATLFSISLQYGVPLQDLVNKFKNQKFPPYGLVFGHPEIKTATSPVDYIAHYLEKRFLSNGSGGNGQEEILDIEQIGGSEEISGGSSDGDEETSGEVRNGEGGACPVCGGIMDLEGSCKETCSCGHIELRGCGG